MLLISVIIVTICFQLVPIYLFLMFYLVAFYYCYYSAICLCFKIWKPFALLYSTTVVSATYCLVTGLYLPLLLQEITKPLFFESRPLICSTNVQIQVLLFGHLSGLVSLRSLSYYWTVKALLRLSALSTILPINYHTHFFVNFLT